MSEGEKNYPPTEEKAKNKDIKKSIQWLIGIVAGLLTSAAIYISGNDFGIKDALLLKLQQYLFIIIFLIMMLGIRGVETKREISLKTVRTAYFIGMLPGLIVFIVLALSQGLVSCG